MGMGIDADEDLELFREAVAGAHPVRDAGKVVPELPKPKPVPIHSQRDEDEALAEALAGPDGLSDQLDIGDADSHLRNGIPRKVLRDLAQGRWAVQDQLDLHGLRVDEARAAVVRFLALSRRRGQRCVLIVHGKGYRSSSGEPVLRNRTRAWLMQKDEVLAFCDAPAGLGGAGAVLILLKAA
jgi:DNA-nicking Smr family endonuclease